MGSWGLMAMLAITRFRFGSSFAHQALLAFALLTTLGVVWAQAGSNKESEFGAFGPEGARMREQLWVVPSGDPNTVLRATVFRPADDVGQKISHPLVVINHGTSADTRLAVSMPVYFWLSRWFVERGYVVILPQRRGYGATAGPYLESIGDCADPDHFASGQVAADDIQAVVAYMRRQPFIKSDQIIVAGASSGGWASLALASRNLPGVRAVINFAGGRGGHSPGQANVVCGEDRLINAVRAYGQTARIPTIWFYAQNDSYFGPPLASAMAAAWRGGGGSVELHISSPYGDDGHAFVDDKAGWNIWGPALDHFLQSEVKVPITVVSREIDKPL